MIGYTEAVLGCAQAKVTVLAENGLGFGEGSIGVKCRLADENDGLSEDILDRTQETLHGGDALVAISKDETGQMLTDDGCGDGRGVVKIYDQDREYTHSLFRPKVFGGGATMVCSALIGLGKAEDGSIDDAFGRAVDVLESSGINYGGHDDDHARVDNCGCGAIDKSEEIVASVAKYGKVIAETVFSVAIAVGEDTEGLGEDVDFVMDNFRSFKNNCDGSSKGVSKFNMLRSRNKVIKKLEGAHKEVRIALNNVSGYTLDQERIRYISDGEAQVFAVDIWRMQDLSGVFGSDDETTRRRALLSMLVYTLGTSATLTKGDLPVDLIKRI